MSTHRLTVDLTEAESEMIHNLVEKTGRSKEFICRRAFHLLNWYVRQKQAGCSIFSEKDGEKTQLEMFLTGPSPYIE